MFDYSGLLHVAFCVCLCVCEFDGFLKGSEWAPRVAT
jgi:hypothetical protein